MSDTEEVMGGAVVTKGAGWTDAEKVWITSTTHSSLTDLSPQYQFMMKIIGQLTANSSVPVNLGDIDMPGRTTKSLTHLWSKIKNDAASASAGGAPTPTRAKKVTKKPATPRKKAPAKLGKEIHFESVHN